MALRNSWMKDFALSQSIAVDSLKQEAWSALDSWMESRLTELLNVIKCISNQREQHRNKLILDDVATAADLLNIHCSSSEFKLTLPSDTSSFDLESIKNRPIPVPYLPSLKIEWLSINGKPTSTDWLLPVKEAAVPRPWMFKPITQFSREIGAIRPDNSVYQLEYLLPSQSSTIGTLNASESLNMVLDMTQVLVNVISEEERLYLTRILSCIVEEIEMERNPERYVKTKRNQNRLTISKILHSLMYGPAPVPLVPLIFTTISNLLSQIIVYGPLSSCDILLKLLLAFSQNKRVDIFPYVHQICQSILLLLLAPTIGPEPITQITTLVEVKNSAAQSLLHIIEMSESQDLYASICAIFTELLNKEELAVTAAIGIIHACGILGENCVRNVLYPASRSLIQHATITSTCGTDVSRMIDEELNNYFLELLMQTLSIINL